LQYQYVFSSQDSGQTIAEPEPLCASKDGESIASGFFRSQSQLWPCEMTQIVTDAEKGYTATLGRVFEIHF